MPEGSSQHLRRRPTGEREGKGRPRLWPGEEKLGGGGVNLQGEARRGKRAPGSSRAARFIQRVCWPLESQTLYPYQRRVAGSSTLLPLSCSICDLQGF